MNVSLRTQNFNAGLVFGRACPNGELRQKVINEMRKSGYGLDKLDIKKLERRADKIAHVDNPEHDKKLQEWLDDPLRQANLEEDEEFAG